MSAVLSRKKPVTVSDIQIRRKQELLAASIREFGIDTLPPIMQLRSRWDGTKTIAFDSLEEAMRAMVLGEVSGVETPYVLNLLVDIADEGRGANQVGEFHGKLIKHRDVVARFAAVFPEFFIAMAITADAYIAYRWLAEQGDN